MPAPTEVALRAVSPEQSHEIDRLAHSHTAPARTVERARIILALAQGQQPSQDAPVVGVSRPTVYAWIHRFNAEGFRGLEDRPRPGRPPTHTAEQRAEVIATALTDPQTLGLPFGCWTLDRLQAYLHEQKQIPIQRSRIDEILLAEGLRWRHQETWFGAGRSRLRRKKGIIETLSTQPPEGSVVVCLDEMGPESARSFPGQEPVGTQPEPPTDGCRKAGRAKQEIDYGRRGKGYIFGAFRPATGEAFTRLYGSRSAVNWAGFLAQVEAWIPAAVTRVDAILDNRQAHRATDVLLLVLAYPRWEFVVQPKYAVYLNLIEPW